MAIANFGKCITYLAAIGTFGFFLGRILPKNWFRWDQFPYKSYPFEKEGYLYQQLQIQKWHNRVPDMSRILPFLMPPKRLSSKPSLTQLVVMLQETCIAELIHGLLLLGGFFCGHIWPGIGGFTIALLNALGNLPFILIQRYNRPRLLRMYKRLIREVA